MLTKLLKYEVRATARMLLPVYAGMVLAWGLYRIYTALYGALHLTGAVPGILQMLLLFLYGLTVFAAGLMTLLIGARQFYRLLGEDGYFLFTLPVSAAQHIAVKLICATGWLGAYLLLGGLLNRLEGHAAAAPDGSILGVGGDTLYFTGNPLSLGAERLLDAGLVGVVVLAIVCSNLFLFLCIIIGGHWPRHRALASVLSYFGLTYAWQAVFIGAVVAVVNFLASDEGAGAAVAGWVVDFVEGLHRVDGIVPGLWVILAAMAAVLIAVGAALWAIVHHFVAKRLNIV